MPGWWNTFVQRLPECWGMIPVGVVSVIILVLTKKLLGTLYRILYPYVIGRPKNLRVLAGADWAVVTGSTDGIGKAYAFELAQRGFNLVLISRTQGKLDKVAEEIIQKYRQIDVKTVAFDFTRAELHDYESIIFPVLNKLPVGILVNNVGMFVEYPDKMHLVEGGLKFHRDMTIVNTLPITLLSHFVIKQMVARNNRGVIVNVASILGLFPGYGIAAYSANKQYMCMLSDALRKEYADTNITIQTLCPSIVATKMALGQTANFIVPTPEHYANRAIRTIGLVNQTGGCLSHQIQAEMSFNWMPAFVWNAIFKFQSQMLRNEGIKKKEVQQQATKNDSSHTTNLL